jgi:neutral ceramidase
MIIITKPTGFEIGIKRGFRWLILLIATVFYLNACGGTSVTVTPPPVEPLPAPAQFLAGAGEADITPPPGLPLFGYSAPAESHAKGYWTRLKSRAIVFEYRQENKGKRFALVQLDWGAVSGLLYWKVAERLAPLGFAPGEFMLTASHTHAAPGGFFGVLFYNGFGSGGIFLNPFNPVLVDWAADNIAKSIRLAVNDLEPAVIGAEDIMAGGISRNRSLDAWILNFIEDPTAIPYPTVIPRLHVIRVDHLAVDQAGETIPRAAFFLAPLHATSVGSDNELYHGDLFGAASRYIAASLNEKYKLEKPFVAAVAPGPEGDVSPNWKTQGYDEARRIGRRIADSAIEAFDRLNNNLKPVKLSASYIEIPLSNASTSNGNLCEHPMIGVPILAGAEDGRSPLHGKLGVFEGHTREPVGCQGVKVPVAGKLQKILVSGGLPEIAALQVVRFGDVIALATFPGEPTTETGNLAKKELEKIDGFQNTAIVAVANEYMSYIATCKEYQAQHYEGGFTLYGQNESLFFREQFVKLAHKIKNNIPVPLTYNKRTFKPGSKRKVFNSDKKCRPDKWKVKKGKHTIPQYDKNRRLKLVRFYWKGLKTGRICGELPSVSVECNGKPLINNEGAEENDQWLNFIVTRKILNLWCAVWTPPQDITVDGEYRIKVNRPGYEPLFSERFNLKKPEVE